MQRIWITYQTLLFLKTKQNIKKKQLIHINIKCTFVCYAAVSVINRPDNFILVVNVADIFIVPSNLLSQKGRHLHALCNCYRKIATSHLSVSLFIILLLFVWAYFHSRFVEFLCKQDLPFFLLQILCFKT